MKYFNGEVTLRTLHIFLTLWLVPMATVTAQSRNTQWPLDSGSRVRIQAPIFSGKREGTVVRTDGDTLHFRARRGTASDAVALHDIVGIDVHRGTHGRKLKGAVIGFLVAGGIAAGITAATWKQSPGIAIDFGRGGDAAFAGAFAGVAGGLAGLIIGAFETDTWVPVKLPNRT
jgi:hypothetical protein